MALWPRRRRAAAVAERSAPRPEARQPHRPAPAVELDPALDRRIAELAARQRGHVTHAQLVDLGLSPSAIKRRIARGQLIAVFRGVYAVGHVPTDPRARLHAAVLAAGADAVLSHRTAGWLHGILDELPTTIELLRFGGGRAARAGLIVHRTTRPFEVSTVDGLPVTSPLRTLADLRLVLGRAAFARACSSALARGLVSPQALAAAGLDDDTLQAAPTQSELEARFLSLVRRAGLPLPSVNRSIGPYVADFVWPEQKVIVETDGWRAHRGAFERDRERDAELAAAGWIVLRITWRQLERQPTRTIARVARVLALRGWEAPT